MTDTHSISVRSYNMSRIRSKDTKPELLVRKYLTQNGIRYRLHYKKLAGIPDIVIPKYKIAIFINGCFWHGHTSCKYFVYPKSNIKYWEDKLNRNIEKDKKNQSLIIALGWRVLIVWECELKKQKREESLKKLLNEIGQER